MKYLNTIVTILVCSLFATALLVSDKLVDGVWTAKNFYFQFICILIIILLLIKYLFAQVKVKIHFTKLDYFLLGYFLYNVARLVFTPEIPLYNTRIVILSLLIFLFYFFESVLNKFSVIRYNHSFFIIISFLLIGIIQASIGLFQAYNILGYFSSGNFFAFGTFGNPAPFTGFIISSLPFSLGLYLLFEGKTTLERILKYLGAVNFVLIILVLPLTKTRGGWLAGVIGILFILNYKFNLFSKLNFYLNNYLKKTFIAISVFIVVIITIAGLYKIRPDSAFGRLLIWRVSTNIIMEAPIFGIGYDRFHQVYSKYQGDYFLSEKSSKYEKYVAGNVKQAHNDFIEHFSEIGLIGGLLFIGIFSSVFIPKMRKRSEDVENPIYKLSLCAKASIVALICSSLFSYPFQILPTQLNLFFLLAIVKSYKYKETYLNLSIHNKSLRVLVVSNIALILILLSMKNINSVQTYFYWKKAIHFSVNRVYKNAIPIYSNIYSELKDNGNFLINYGTALYFMGKYEQSIRILEKGRLINSDPNLFISLANCYQQLDEKEKAERFYLKAANIIPHKFYPKYLLAKHYLRIEELEKAKKVANEILKMDEKIKSTAVTQIKKEMCDIINLNKCLAK